MKPPRKSVVDFVSRHLNGSATPATEKPKPFSQQIREAAKQERVAPPPERKHISEMVEDVIKSRGTSFTNYLVTKVAPQRPVDDDGEHISITELIKKGKPLT